MKGKTSFLIKVVSKKESVYRKKTGMTFWLTISKILPINQILFPYFFKLFQVFCERNPTVHFQRLSNTHRRIGYGNADLPVAHVKPKYAHAGIIAISKGYSNII